VWRNAVRGDLQAVESAVRNLRTQARLLGINGPQRIQVDSEQIDRQAAALFAELLGEVPQDDADDN
jgi:hypothetical protein